MVIVVFEVTMKPGRDEDYFALAARLREALEKVDGFLSVERFKSLTEEGKYLSLSTWRDEAAVTAWREQADHRAAQALGKGDLFADFRIRVAEVSRDYTLTDRL